MHGWRPLTILLTLLAMVAGGAVIAACGDDAEQGDEAATVGQADQAPADGGTGAGGDRPAGDGDRDRPAGGGGSAGGGSGGATGDDANSDAPAKSKPANPPYDPDPSTPEGQANTTVKGVYDTLATGGGKLDAGGFCDLMTPKAQRQTTRYAEVSSGVAKDWNCELAVEQLVDRSKRTGGFKRVRNVEVLGVNIEGDRATATIRFGDGPATSLPLSRHGGAWKLDGTPSGG